MPGIEAIADDGVADVGHVNANLMRPTRFRLDMQIAETDESLDNFVTRACLTTC